MKTYLKHFILFLFLNFGGLAIGAFLQGDIINNVWYAGLKTASWSPPGWTFGVAWTQIMIFYSIFLTILSHRISIREVISLFGISWILNVAWNPIFFRLHAVGTALVVLLLLSISILIFFFRYQPTMQKRSLLLVPYIIWLIIAISLNAYVLLNN